MNFPLHFVDESAPFFNRLFTDFELHNNNNNNNNNNNIYLNHMQIQCTVTFMKTIIKKNKKEFINNESKCKEITVNKGT